MPRLSGFCLLVVLLCGCVASTPASTLTLSLDILAATHTFTPQFTETPTLTLTPTEIPMPAGLATVPEGFSAVHNPDGTWGYGVGADGTPIPSLTVDATGAHFVFNGVKIDIAAAAIADRIKVGQSGALQIYNESGTGIDYAYDIENNVWIKASDVLQPDPSNTEKYIHVKTWSELANLDRLQPLVLPPFPADTYSWLPDKVIVDYLDTKKNLDDTLDYSVWTPLGVLTDFSKSPFRVVSYTLLEKGEGRSQDYYILTEQVYNPYDGSFSILYFVDDFTNGTSFSSTQTKMGPDEYYLPDYLHTGYLESDGSRTMIKKAVTDKWLTLRHLPPELENILFGWGSDSDRSFEK